MVHGLPASVSISEGIRTGIGQEHLEEREVVVEGLGQRRTMIFFSETISFLLSQMDQQIATTPSKRSGFKVSISPKPVAMTNGLHGCNVPWSMPYMGYSIRQIHDTFGWGCSPTRPIFA